MPARILIVEDERITAEDLRDILTDLGYTVTGSVSSGAEAIAQAEEAPPDLALMDIRIKGEMDGAETARILRERFNIPVVYLTAHADTSTLSRAKLAQPLGYIVKPFQETELHASIEIALHKHREDLKVRGQEELVASTLRAIAEGVIAVDKPESVTLLNPAAEAWTGWNAREALGKPLREVFSVVDSVTGDELETPLWRVLTEGTVEELGSGALLADRSGAKRPILCSIAPTRDHRGEVSGAVLVFGRASREPGGVRRLGGVRDIQVDVRVVAATNRKLTEAIEQGKFRLDLYYRLNVIQVLLPPLRDRKEDIIPLADTFIRHYNTKFKRKIEGLSHGAAGLLLGYEWPGNVRELRNVIERAMVLEESDWIQTSSLQISPALGGLPAAETLPQVVDGKFDVSLEEAEKSLLVKALEKAEGNQTRAAVLLGITRDTLRYKIKKFNLR